MRKFTKLALSLAMCFVGIASVQAEEKVYATFDKCTSGGNLTWDSENSSFSWTASYSNQLHGITLPNGNITEYSKVVVNCDILEGDGYRFMFYASNKGTTAGGTTVVTESGEKVYTLSDLGMDADYLTNNSEFCLSGYNGSGKVKVNYVYFVKSDDPLAGQKKLLTDALTIAKQQNAFAKTSESFAALTTAISAAESVLADKAATSETLDAATKSVNDAVAALQLQAGYTNLTADMFLKYASVENPGVGEKAYPAYDLNKASDLPYGDGNVGELNWADLTNYDKLVVVTASDVKPRICLNRLVANGQQAETQEDSKLLDINPNNAFNWSTEKYETIDGNVYTIDLKAIVADYGFARLHCIKKQGWGAGVIVTDMYLYNAASVTVGAAGYATFCSPEAIDFTGVEAYAAKVEGGKVVLTAVAKAAANTPVIIKAAAGTYNLAYAETADAVAGNELLASDGTVAADGTIYVLANKTKGAGFYKLADGQTVPAGKAYLKLAAQSPEFLAFAGAETTGIEQIRDSRSVANCCYDLSGRKIVNSKSVNGKLQKGLYIVGGKKVVVK